MANQKEYPVFATMKEEQVKALIKNDDGVMSSTGTSSSSKCDGTEVHCCPRPHIKVIESDEVPSGYALETPTCLYEIEVE